MGKQKIVVLGGGFAGLWSAIGAARKWAEGGRAPDDIEISIVDRNRFHSIRVRNYEEDLAATTLPFADLLDPVGVKHVAGSVLAIDVLAQFVGVTTDAGERRLDYDRLVVALGSQLHRPSLPGLVEHGFDIDTYDGAMRLAKHLASMPSQPVSKGRNTVLVIGAGLTGLELATELPERLGRLFGPGSFRIILADSSPVIAAGMGDEARPIILEALGSLGIQTRTAIAVARVDKNGVLLASGEFIPASTVVWCGGMRANPLTATLPVERDALGRVRIDDFTQVVGLRNVFAAGDSAWNLIDGTNPSVMSCQHGRPMGRFAGHNVAAHLLGEPMLPFRIGWYTTVLDLGNWGALYTIGRDRKILSKKESAKATKRMINRERIYPPRPATRDALFAAADPIIPSPPPQIFPRAAFDRDSCDGAGTTNSPNPGVSSRLGTVTSLPLQRSLSQ